MCMYIYIYILYHITIVHQLIRQLNAIFGGSVPRSAKVRLRVLLEGYVPHGHARPQELHIF